MDHGALIFSFKLIFCPKKGVPDMGLNKLSSWIISVFALCGNALAVEYSCSAKEHGYSHAINAFVASTINEKLTAAKWYVPERFTINSEVLKFKGKPPMDITGGDRVSTFTALVRSQKYKLQYQIQINKFESSGTVISKALGNYKTPGPVFFNCYQARSSNQAANSAQGSIERSEFKRLSSCNRRYVQQFLKGQGFYSSSIDGKWGPGTAAAIKRAMKMPKFRNLTAAQFFDKLENNPMC